MLKQKRIILVPRYGATEKDDWYQWLEREVQTNKNILVSEWIFCELKPNNQEPRLKQCNKNLKTLLGRDNDMLSSTIIIAHSLGVQIALRTLAGMDAGTKIGGILCIAGWLSLDHSPSTLTEWTESTFDHKAARSNISKLVNLISTNDPNQINTTEVSEAWRDGKLNAEIVLSAAPGHMSEPEEPDVLDTLLRYFG